MPKASQKSSLILPRLTKNALIRAAFATFLLFCAQAANAQDYFISLDGLQPKLLDALIAGGQLTAPHGLSWLRGGFVVDRAWPVVTTSTSPSHISTITCSPPSRHGIIANNFRRDGQAVSGFQASFRGEPFWRAAMQQGRNVLAVAYVGADGTTPQRSATFGLAYPDSALLGKRQAGTLDSKTLTPAVGWSHLPQDAAKARESSVRLLLNSRSGEQRELSVLLVEHGQEADLYLAANKLADLQHMTRLTLTGGNVSRADLYLDEHSVPARKRRIILRAKRAADGTVALNWSAATYNNAYPDAVRQRLDALNLVWPDLAGGGRDANPSDFVQSQRELDRFLTDAAVLLADELKPEIVLFYQPLLDSVGHRFQNQLPEPFAAPAIDPVTTAYRDAFTAIDQDLSVLLAKVTAKNVVAAMGDHGMDATRQSLNLATLLPAAAREQIVLVTSGLLTLIYPTSPDAAHAATADQIGMQLQKQLSTFQDPSRHSAVLAASWRRQDAKPAPQPDYRNEWQYGDAVWAFAPAQGLAFLDDPLSREAWLPPASGGLHGTALTVPSMATTLMIRGGQAPQRHIAEASLLDAIPTFAALIGVKPPADCLGQSLLMKR